MLAVGLAQKLRVEALAATRERSLERMNAAVLMVAIACDEEGNRLSRLEITRPKCRSLGGMEPKKRVLLLQQKSSTSFSIPTLPYRISLNSAQPHKSLPIAPYR